jgi:uncharacterized protein YdeI (YjbR/CyaY-like superfamily)
MTATIRAKFFADAAAWRKWLAANHSTKSELWVGFYKRDSGRKSITWPESVDQALCFGWIDGVRYSIDEVSYRIRFTPRRRGSTWSAVNIKRMQALIDANLVRAAGKAAYANRQEKRSGVYSYEQRSVELPPKYARTIRTNDRAWADYQSRPPSYRKVVNWWVVSAKTEATRAKRLAELIAACERHEKVGAVPQKKRPGG